MDRIPTVHIDMDALCEECGEPGATRSGICLACGAKAFGDVLFKSEAGRAVQENVKRLRQLKSQLKEEKMVKKTHNVEGVLNHGQLRSFVQRLEKLAADKAAITDDEKVVCAEAKAAGFDVKIIKLAIKRRKADPQKLRELEDLLQIYEEAIGDLAGTPLGIAGQPKSIN